MKQQPLTYRFFLSLLIVLLISSNLKSQELPEYLGDDSRETLDRIQREMDNWMDLAAGLNVGYFTSVITSEPEMTAAQQGVDPSFLGEALSRIPQAARARVSDIITEHIALNGNSFNDEEMDYWNQFYELIQRPDSHTSNGSSYGDPHIITFDGLRYSFQTVGEYVLSRSSRGNFEVQSRQSAVRSSLSLNSAVAMNVGGDTVCIYMSGYPDSVTSTPLRVNSKPVTVTDKPYLLNRGGFIKLINSDIQVAWATGEQVIVQIFNMGEYNYLNIIPQIYPSENVKYEGILGNANGEPNDDLTTKGGGFIAAEAGYFKASEMLGFMKVNNAALKAKKMYQKRLAKDFGDSWRITDANSLFGYKPGFNTSSYTDYGFPEDYLTLSELSNEEIQNAQKVCEESGVAGEELQGCIYDVAFSDYQGFARATARVVSTLDLLAELGIENPLRPLLPQNLKEKAKKETQKRIQKWLKKL